MDVREAYATLGIEPGATAAEVREAYLDLVKVWHPDRHSHEPRLQAKAQEKLRQINLAYETVETARAQAATRAAPAPPSAAPPAATATQPATAGGNGNQPGAPPPFRNATVDKPVRGTQATILRLAGWVLGFAAASALFGRTTGTCQDDSDTSAGPRMAAPSVSPSRAGNSTTPPPRQERSTLQGRAAEPPPGAPAQPEAKSQAAFTLGSTRQQVEAVHGVPDSIDRLGGETWWYGASRIAFKKGRVHAWSSSSVSPLHVQLLPRDAAAADAARSRGYFTIGSTYDEILALHGTPTELDRVFGETWWFGSARIGFKNGRVTQWNSSPMIGLPLKAKLLPKKPEAAEAALARGSYAQGASTDEVLGVEGTPDSIEFEFGEVWWYGASRLEFRRGRLSEWSSSPTRPLRIGKSTEAVASSGGVSFATVDGFLDALTKEIDVAADEICACTTRECATIVAQGMMERGIRTGAAYTRGKSISPELAAVFESRRRDNDGAAVSAWIQAQRPAWFKDFKPRLEACIARLPR